MINFQPIDCCNPRFIMNPYIDVLILQNGGYRIGGFDYVLSSDQYDQWVVSFPFHLFYPRTHGINKDNYEDCYIFNVTTGEIFPMYYAVPCNKCEVCKDRKANDWSTRCSMETQCHDFYPVFLTLTYAPEYLPEDGLQKRDVQLYINRLRMRLKRAGYNCKIRYICVGEYGKNTHRAHYHLIFWGLPAIDTRLLNEILSDTWSFGFINWSYIGSDNKKTSAVSYCMKYMRKDCFVPKGQNPTFFLASRGEGGIGYLYMKDYLGYYRSNPTNCMITINDKFTGRQMEYPLPKAFLIKVFPPMSAYCPKDVRDMFSNFMRAVKYIRTVQYIRDGEFTPFLDPRFQDVATKYSFLPQFTQKHISPQDLKDVSFYLSKIDLNEYLRTLYATVDRYYDKLMQFPDYEPLVSYFRDLKNRRAELLSRMPKRMFNTDVKREKILKRLRDAELREIF